MAKALIRVGVFGAPHGVRGEIRLKSFTQEPDTIGRLGTLTDAAGLRSFDIVALRPLKDDLFVARIRGLADRTAAEALTNVPLYVARDKLPAVAEDEFYHADLIGLRAQTPQGEILGRIVALPDFGAGDLLEIAPKGGGETLLFPFTKACVPEIDILGGHVIVVPPAEVEAAEPEE